MIARQQLVEYCDTILDSGSLQDYCPNGLQVQGRDEVSRLVSAVTASLEVIETAVQRGADLILVHHGYFWKNEEPAITGIKYQRIKSLLDNDINLLAYHLPLDVHPELGNNAQLARILGLHVEGGIQDDPRRPALVLRGRLSQPMSADALSQHISGCLGRTPLHIPGQAGNIETVAWCTGAAQNYIELAAMAGVDAYISGEISEQTVHQARELGIHYFSAGHHATERYGVQALGMHLADKFDLQHEFLDQENPV
jgi:dinuclear metal center YbgI/SA1388 family protein